MLLGKGVPQSMQQIYSRTPVPNCDFNKVSRHGCSPVNLLHIYRTSFPKNTSWLMFLNSLVGLSSWALLLPYWIQLSHILSCFTLLNQWKTEEPLNNTELSYTAWKVSKYGPSKTPYLENFHTVLLNPTWLCRRNSFRDFAMETELVSDKVT